MVFFWPLMVTHLFKTQFPTKNCLTKFFIKVHRLRLIHQKLDSKGFFRPLVETHLFKIQFPTIDFLAKFLIKMHWIRLTNQKLNSKDFFLPLVTTHLFKIKFLTKKIPNKIFHKNASISTYSPKTEFERLFRTPGVDTLI